MWFIPQTLSLTAEQPSIDEIAAAVMLNDFASVATWKRVCAEDAATQALIARATSANSDAQLFAQDIVSALGAQCSEPAPVIGADEDWLDLPLFGCSERRLRTFSAISEAAWNEWVAGERRRRDARVQRGWATPTRGDGARFERLDVWERRRRRKAQQGINLHRPLTIEVQLEGAGGRLLNPRWVETLMGLPVGWVMPSCKKIATIAPCDG